MNIRQILDKKRTLSFEFFPPKLELPIEPLFETLDTLDRYEPDFISVTYGAGGTNRGRNDDVCKYVLDKNQNLISHFTTIGNTKNDVKENIQRYIDMGVENLLALRGDLPKGWTGTGGDYKHGTHLIEDIAKLFPSLCVGGACYPEKHIEGKSVEEDVKIMKIKEDFGCKYFVTQLCYDLNAYENFMDLNVKHNITSPVVVGIMPAINKNVVLRITGENECSLPKDLKAIIDKYEDKDDFKKAGIEYTQKLIEKYIALDVAGIHIYTLNKWQDIVEILDGSNLAPIR